MLNSSLFTEQQIIDTFGKPVAVRLRILTGGGHAVFDEFKINGYSYLGGYDNCRDIYYILNPDTPIIQKILPKSSGQIITVRTKQEKKPKRRLFELLRT